MRLSVTLVGVAILGTFPILAQNETTWTVPRTSDGHPDLQGVWTNKTITPLERPKELGNKAFFTPEEVKAFTQTTLERSDKDLRGGGVRDVLTIIFRDLLAIRHHVAAIHGETRRNLSYRAPHLGPRVVSAVAICLTNLDKQ